MSGSAADPGPARPCAVTMVLPFLDEARHLPATLASLAEQVVPGGDLEVLVVDGGSTDGSSDIVRRFVPPLGTTMRVRVITNPAQNATAGFNIGIREAKGEVIGLGGARTVYPPGHLATAIAVLRDTGADAVGGGVRAFLAAGPGVVAQAMACLYISPVGAGAAAYHRRQSAGPVDTVYCGFYLREVLLRLGGLDERFVRAQDAELNARIVSSGGVVWFDPRLSTDYQFRGGLWAFLRRGWLTGVQVSRGWFWRPGTIRLRHLAPLAWSLFLVFGGLLAVAGPIVRPFFIAGSAIYLGALTLSALALIARAGWGAALLTVPLFALFHLAYGAGQVRGLAAVLAGANSPPKAR